MFSVTQQEHFMNGALENGDFALCWFSYCGLHLFFKLNMLVFSFHFPVCLLIPFWRNAQ